MDKVYSQASSVVGWLGEFCSDETCLFDTSQYCCSCFEHRREGCYCWTSRCTHRRWGPVMIAFLEPQRLGNSMADYGGVWAGEEHRAWVHRHEPFDENRDLESARSVITQIYSSSWWRRGWVLQEVLLSAKPPLAMFAGNSVPLLVLTHPGLWSFSD